MYQKVDEFPALFADQNADPAWPTVVSKSFDNAGFMLTFRDTDTEPVVSYAITGDYEQVAKHIAETIFLDEHLTRMLIKHLFATTKTDIQNIIFEPSSN
jgi:hypothetical protein